MNDVARTSKEHIEAHLIIHREILRRAPRRLCQYDEVELESLEIVQDTIRESRDLLVALVYNRVEEKKVYYRRKYIPAEHAE